MNTPTNMQRPTFVRQQLRETTTLIKNYSTAPVGRLSAESFNKLGSLVRVHEFHLLLCCLSLLLALVRIVAHVCFKLHVECFGGALEML